MSDTEQAAVQFDTLDTADGRQIGIARLHQPKSLNALSLEMIRLLHPQLTAWANDERVVAVWLEGSGDKAFCAGGDVVALYRAMTDGNIEDGYTFFREEYALDYAIHTYPKPLIVWGNGIVMGGGLGLLAGASHRVVTASSRIAMPEITIGLYPDVGGSWFLNRMPGRCGLFLGLTGANMNAKDALFVGLADRLIRHQQRQPVLDALAASDWQAPAEQVVGSVLRQFEQQDASDEAVAGLTSAVRDHFDVIQSLTDADDLASLVAQIGAYQGEVVWLQKAAATLNAGSPTTMAMVWHQLRQLRHASLTEVFDSELALSCRCLENGEFREGVRALLIDKDRTPQWHARQVSDLSEAWLARFFTTP